MEDGPPWVVSVKSCQLLSQFTFGSLFAEPESGKQISSPTMSVTGLFQATFGWLFFCARVFCLESKLVSGRIATTSDLPLTHLANFKAEIMVRGTRAPEAQ